MSASVIGALRVNLGLDSAQFEKGVGRSQSGLQKFAARAGAIAGGLAATMKTAFVSMGLSAINAGAEIQRLAQLTNTAPLQFQGWAAGAKSVGIEQEKLADILKDTNDRIGDFVQTGGGPMADFFDKIAPKVGVTADSFRNLSGADALQLYVSSLEKANLNQQDFTFYMEAMASDSTLLLPLLRNGGQAMAEYAEKAQRMGAVMSGPMLASLQEGKAALAEMRMAVDGMRNTIGTLAVPAIKALAAAIGAAAMFFHEHADAIASALRTLAGVAMVVAAAFATRYAVALGVTAVRAMVSAVTQSVALEIALGAQSRAAAVASAASKGLATALGVLRGAIIATGIGALVIAAGYLVGKFMELVSATGSLGAALKALGELAGLVWQGIVKSASAVPPALIAVWELVKADFANTMADLAAMWSGFVSSMTDTVLGPAELDIGFGLGKVKNPFANLFDGAIDGAGDFEVRMRSAASSAANSASIAASEVANTVKTAFGPVGAKWKELKGAVDETGGAMTDVVPAAVAAGDATDGAGNKAKAAAEKVSELQRVMTDLRAEAERLRATMAMSDVDAKVWENLRDAGASAGSGAGQQIDALTRQIHGMEELKAATEDWKSSLSEGFRELSRRGSSFGDVLSGLLSKFADMLWSKGFDTLWNGGGFSSFIGGALGWLGIGSNANGTNNWRGGLTGLHERGGEILNLPRGTQVIPNDISKRMADKAASGAASININVSGARGNAEIEAMVASGVRQGLQHYDRDVLPDSVLRVSGDNNQRYGNT